MKFNLKGNKLYFNDFFFINLNKDTILEYDLKNREEITDNEYRELIKKRAYSMGYFLLSSRDYSSGDLSKKLVSKYREKDIIKEIIDDFCEKGYIDDYEYGKSYINNHNYGRKKMEFMLLQKGLNSNMIKELLDECSDKELEEAKKQWVKLGNKEKEKKILSMMRKGFEYSMILRAISELEE